MSNQAVYITESKGFWSTSSGASAPKYTQLSLLTFPPSQKYTSPLNQTSSRKSWSSSILFSNHRHITKRFFMLALWVYVWSGFCMGTTEEPSLRFFATKDQVLGNVLGETFSDCFRQNLSLHSHFQDILQSTSWQIWDFLPSCWGCLLTLWLQICTPNDKFVFCG